MPSASFECTIDLSSLFSNSPQIYFEGVSPSFSMFQQIPSIADSSWVYGYYNGQFNKNNWNLLNMPCSNSFGHHWTYIHTHIYHFIRLLGFFATRKSLWLITKHDFKFKFYWQPIIWGHTHTHTHTHNSQDECLWLWMSPRALVSVCAAGYWPQAVGAKLPAGA